jgi:hypothetical protein
VFEAPERPVETVEGHLDALVNLPEVDVVGAKATKRVFEHLHRDVGIATVGAYLGHQKHSITTTNQPLTENTACKRRSLARLRRTVERNGNGHGRGR